MSAAGQHCFQFAAVETFRQLPPEQTRRHHRPHRDLLRPSTTNPAVLTFRDKRTIEWRRREPTPL